MLLLAQMHMAESESYIAASSISELLLLRWRDFSTVVWLQ